MFRIMLLIMSLSTVQPGGLNITRISPLFGQANGGTKVTAEGFFPSDVKVNIIGQSASLKFRRLGENITFKMPPGRKNSTVLIEISSHSGTKSRNLYEYTDNPEIISCSGLSTIVSGGITFTAVVKRLSSAHEYKLRLEDQNNSWYEASCESDESDDAKISAVFPDFMDEEWFTEEQLKGSGKLVATIYAELIGDGVPVSGRVNLAIKVFQDPVIDNLTEPFHFNHEKKTHLQLTGSMLGLIDDYEDIYTITIGDLGECMDVVVLNESIECFPPFTPKVHFGNLYAIRIQVGEEEYLDFHPGFVVYDSLDYLTKGQLAATILVPILVVAAMATAIVMCMRRRFHITRGSELSTAGISNILASSEGGLEMMVNSDLKMRVDRIRIDPDDLSINARLLIGKGQFGCIYMGQLKLTGGKVLKTVAVKTLKDTQDIDTHMVEIFLQEATLLSSCRHANILSTIGVVWQKGDRPMVVMPYMSRGDLRSLVSKHDLELTNGDILHFCMQIAAGMEYMSSHKFVHRDLAARNCLVDDAFLVKIADFGMSKDIYDRDYYREGDKSKPKPIRWMAIESIQQGTYNSSTDVWAFGVTMWELCTRGSTPYPGIDNKELLDYLESGERLYKPVHTHRDIYSLMVQCWDSDSQARPSFQHIHRFLMEYLENPSHRKRQDLYSYVQLHTKHIPCD